MSRDRLRPSFFFLSTIPLPPTLPRFIPSFPQRQAAIVFHDFRIARTSVPGRASMFYGAVMENKINILILALHGAVPGVPTYQDGMYLALNGVAWDRGMASSGL